MFPFINPFKSVNDNPGKELELMAVLTKCNKFRSVYTMTMFFLNVNYANKLIKR